MRPVQPFIHFIRQKQALYSYIIVNFILRARAGGKSKMPSLSLSSTFMHYLLRNKSTFASVQLTF